MERERDAGNVLVAFALLLSLPMLLFLFVSLMIVEPWSLTVPGLVVAWFAVRHLAGTRGRREAAVARELARVRHAEAAARVEAARVRVREAEARYAAASVRAKEAHARATAARRVTSR